eukprot:g2092.t1
MPSRCDSPLSLPRSGSPGLHLPDECPLSLPRVGSPGLNLPDVETPVFLPPRGRTAGSPPGSAVGQVPPTRRHFNSLARSSSHFTNRCPEADGAGPTASKSSAEPQSSELVRSGSLPPGWVHVRPNETDRRPDASRCCLGKLLRRIARMAPRRGLHPNAVKTARHNLLTFAPATIVRIFAQPANIYFLLICFFQLMPEVSPTGGIPTQVLPLSVIVCVELLKAGVETYRRILSDRRENERICYRVVDVGEDEEDVEEKEIGGDSGGSSEGTALGSDVEELQHGVDVIDFSLPPDKLGHGQRKVSLRSSSSDQEEELRGTVPELDRLAKFSEKEASSGPCLVLRPYVADAVGNKPNQGHAPADHYDDTTILPVVESQHREPSIATVKTSPPTPPPTAAVERHESQAQMRRFMRKLKEQVQESNRMQRKLRRRIFSKSSAPLLDGRREPVRHNSYGTMAAPNKIDGRGGREQQQPHLRRVVPKSVPSMRTSFARRQSAFMTATRSEKELERVKWQRVAVGDVLQLQVGDELPADAVLLPHRDNSGSRAVVYVETASLDGETNLKMKKSLALGSGGVVGGDGGVGGNRSSHRLLEPKTTMKQDFAIAVEPPSASLSAFCGRVDLFSSEGTTNKLELQDGSASGALSMDNLLLRGTVLRKIATPPGGGESSTEQDAVDSVLAVVVYAGSDARVIRNGFCAELSKPSFFDYWIDYVMLRCVLFEAAFCLSLAAFSSISDPEAGDLDTLLGRGGTAGTGGRGGGPDSSATGGTTPPSRAFYRPLIDLLLAFLRTRRAAIEGSAFFRVLVVVLLDTLPKTLTWITMCNNFVPISLVVMLEIARVFQIWLLIVDEKMLVAEEGVGAPSSSPTSTRGRIGSGAENTAGAAAESVDQVGTSARLASPGDDMKITEKDSRSAVDLLDMSFVSRALSPGRLSSSSSSSGNVDAGFNHQEAPFIRAESGHGPDGKGQSVDRKQNGGPAAITGRTPPPASMVRGSRAVVKTDFPPHSSARMSRDAGVSVEDYVSVKDARPRVHRTNLLEELGHVTHVVTDKTGTLTKNEMRFHALWVAATASSGIDDVGAKTNPAPAANAPEGDSGRNISTMDAGGAEILGCDHEHDSKWSLQQEGTKAGCRETRIAGIERLEQEGRGRAATSSSSFRGAAARTDSFIPSFQDAPNSPWARASPSAKAILATALCHSCQVDESSGEISSASVEEVALVEALADRCGIKFVARTEDEAAGSTFYRFELLTSGNESSHVGASVDEKDKRSATRREDGLRMSSPGRRLTPASLDDLHDEILTVLRPPRIGTQRQRASGGVVEAGTPPSCHRRSAAAAVDNEIVWNLARPPVILPVSHEKILAGRSRALSKERRVLGGTNWLWDQSALEPTEAQPNSRRFLTAEVVEVIPFSSERKRMSVVCRFAGDVGDELVLICKGADSVLEELRRVEDKDNLEGLKAAVSAYSQEGLRTLVYGWRRIHPYELAGYRIRAKPSSHPCSMKSNETPASSCRSSLASVNSLASRTVRKKSHQMNKSIEDDLRLLSVTAIEDALADGVPETVGALQRAGIKLWVCTGDKVETAVAVARQCGIVKRHRGVGGGSPNCEEERVVILDEALRADPVSGEARDWGGALDAILASSAPAVVVVTGDFFAENVVAPKKRPRTPTIKQPLQSHHHGHRFDALFATASAVVCCRVSPSQKRDVVEYLKNLRADSKIGTSSTKNFVLAIGDGANDAGMIKEATVGVGLLGGKEGSTAARVSDVACAHFHNLARLVLIHGREAHRKNAVLLAYHVYKNTVGVLPFVWFGFLANLATGVQYVEPRLYALYNVLFVCFPITVFGWLDRQCDDLGDLVRNRSEGGGKTNTYAKCMRMSMTAGESAGAAFVINGGGEDQDGRGSERRRGKKSLGGGSWMWGAVRKRLSFGKDNPGEGDASSAPGKNSKAAAGRGRVAAQSEAAAASIDAATIRPYETGYLSRRFLFYFFALGVFHSVLVHVFCFDTAFTGSALDAYSSELAPRAVFAFLLMILLANFTLLWELCSVELGTISSAVLGTATYVGAIAALNCGYDLSEKYNPKDAYLMDMTDVRGWLLGIRDAGLPDNNPMACQLPLSVLVCFLLASVPSWVRLGRGKIEEGVRKGAGRRGTCGGEQMSGAGGDAASVDVVIQ